MKKYLYMFFLLFWSMFLPLQCAEADVVLVLSGGGTRGFAHIGVIEVLEKQGISVVGVVGTSIGSLIGGLYASGYNSTNLREMALTLDLPALLSENAGPMYNTGDDRESRMRTISALTYTYKKATKQSGPLGLLTGDKLFQYYNQLMHNVNITDFNKLPIPFAAIAADLKNGEKVVLRSGSLPSAMRASMSIPAIFEPWEIDGRILVDGGVVSNLPVNTAKELFPRFPIIAVDVSDFPSEERSVGSFIDVFDQSITIAMRKTTMEEARGADIVLAPNVHEFPFLGGSDMDVDEIIARGREAALASIEKIRALSQSSSPAQVRQKQQPHISIIDDVLVRGLPDAACGQLRKRFLRWVGKPFDPKDVERAMNRLMSTPDIATVDYQLQPVTEDKSTLILNVRRRPDFEVGISGYATNLSPNRWLYLKGATRGVFSELDSIRGVIRVGEQWGIDLTYLTAPEPMRSWEFTLAVQNWEMGNRSSYRYALGGQYLFHVGEVRMGLGLAYEHINRKGSSDSLGPTFFAAHDTLDIPSDPTQGQAWRFNAWWPNADELLYRVSYFKPIKVDAMWRTYLRLGYAEGNMRKRGHAVALGAAEELYSVSNRSIEAERMVWANIAFRHILKRSVWGIVAAEAFGGFGYAMKEKYSRVASPWEAGVAINIPNNIIDVKVAAMYGSEKFKLGFFMGVPIWDHYPLP